MHNHFGIIQLLCFRLVIDNLLEPILTSPHWSEPRRRYLETTALFGVSLVAAVMVPSIGSLISLLGFSGAIFVFICPGIYFAFFSCLANYFKTHCSPYIWVVHNAIIIMSGKLCLQDVLTRRGDKVLHAGFGES